jgi:Mg/Co/Ni transporter MgtE
MRREPKLIHPNDSLDEAFIVVMQEGQAVPVVDDHGRLVGMLTSDSVGEFLLVKSALDERKQKGLGGRQPLNEARVLGPPTTSA